MPRCGLTTLAVVVIAVVALAGASACAQGYPPVGLSVLRATCVQRKDIPQPAIASYCDCYVDLMQKTVPWPDYVLLDLAMGHKPLADLDDEEKSILGQAMETAAYCSQKATR
jgi:hypothetical protein